MAACSAKVKVDAANVRSDPRTTSSIVGIARRDNTLPVQDVSSKDSAGFRWFRITLPTNNSEGWIREDLIQLSGECADFGVLSTTPEGVPIDTSTTPIPDAIEIEGSVLVGDCQATVRVFMARVRGLPNRSGQTLGMLSRGTGFTIELISKPDEEGFKWFGFEFNNERGWTREDLVEVTGDCLDLSTHNEPEEDEDVETPVPTPDPADCTARISLEHVNVRLQPSATSVLVGRATRGDTFTVKNITDPQPDGFNWVKIDFRGRDGHIRFDLVSLQGDCSVFISDTRFPAPVGANCSQGFKPTHQGLDFPIPVGTELCCPAKAVVVRSHACRNCDSGPGHIFSNDPAEINRIFSDADWGFGYGNHVIIRIEFEDLHPMVQQELFNAGAIPGDSIFILYAHLSRRDVNINDILESGHAFGLTGHTGYSTAPHLHLEVAHGKTWSTARKIHPSHIFMVQNI